MDMNTLKTFIGNELAEGRTMDEILANIAATANEIEAERRNADKSAAIKTAIQKGTKAIIADIAASGKKKLITEDLMLLVLAWLNEETGIVEKLGDDYDFATVMKEGEAGLKDIIAGIEVSCKLANGLCDVFKCNQHVKDETDPRIAFFKEFGLL